MPTSPVPAHPTVWVLLLAAQLVCGASPGAQGQSPSTDAYGDV